MDVGGAAQLKILKEEKIGKEKKESGRAEAICIRPNEQQTGKREYCTHDHYGTIWHAPTQRENDNVETKMEKQGLYVYGLNREISFEDLWRKKKEKNFYKTTNEKK